MSTKAQHVSAPVSARDAFRDTSQPLLLFSLLQNPTLQIVIMSRLPVYDNAIPLGCPARGALLLISGYSGLPTLSCVTLVFLEVIHVTAAADTLC